MNTKLHSPPRTPNHPVPALREPRIAPLHQPRSYETPRTLVIGALDHTRFPPTVYGLEDTQGS